MHARLGAALATAAIAVAVIPAHAATAPATPGPTPQITDPTGDANFINGQAPGAPVPSQTTPVDQASADITSVLFQTTYLTQTFTKKVTVVVKKKKVTKTVTFTIKIPTGFTVTMNLAAAPGPETEYRVVTTKGGCASFFFEYSTDALVDSGADPTGSLAQQTQMRCASGEEKTAYTVAPATVNGSSITWTVPLSQLPLGTSFTNLAAETTVNPAALTSPFYDTASSSGSFTVGK